MEVREAASEAEIESALRLRERVFCGEQGVPLAADRDGLDGEALHVIALDDGELLGTCRLVFGERIARLGRLAVEPARRGAGVAGAILSEADRLARAGGAEAIALHAQTYALALYREAGYLERGDRFVEEGIEHVAMEKALA